MVGLQTLQWTGFTLCSNTYPGLVACHFFSTCLKKNLSDGLYRPAVLVNETGKITHWLYSPTNFWHKDHHALLMPSVWHPVMFTVPNSFLHLTLMQSTISPHYGWSMPTHNARVWQAEKSSTRVHLNREFNGRYVLDNHLWKELHNGTSAFSVTPWHMHRFSTSMLRFWPMYLQRNRQRNMCHCCCLHLNSPPPTETSTATVNSFKDDMRRFFTKLMKSSF